MTFRKDFGRDLMPPPTQRENDVSWDVGMVQVLKRIAVQIETNSPIRIKVDDKTRGPTEEHGLGRPPNEGQSLSGKGIGGLRQVEGNFQPPRRASRDATDTDLRRDLRCSDEICAWLETFTPQGIPFFLGDLPCLSELGFCLANGSFDDLGLKFERHR